MDHAGATQYSERQIADALTNLASNVYSNPHTSRATEDVIDQVRYKTLGFFNTSTDDYEVIFTSGATASLKLVAETFDFGDNGAFVYLRDNHTSVLGMREVVYARKICCLERGDLLNDPVSLPDLSESGNSLVVFPAQCNFSGFKYPLDLIEKIQESGEQKNRFVFLDAASFVGSNPLDLQKYHPDFVCVSFYKIFGYPTGLGALIVNKRACSVLLKKYYGGGTVKISLSDASKWHEKRDALHER